MKERVTSGVSSVLMLAGLVSVALTSSIGSVPAPVSDTLAQRLQTGKVAVEAPAAVPAPAVQVAAAAAPATPFNTLKVDTSYYDQLRSKLTWLPVRYAGNVLKTPDVPSRLLLAKSAAQRAGLSEVGLSYRDVYGIINAETSWIPRMGASKDGTPNLGIAQFEPATAKAVGLTDPTDPVQAVHALAVHLKDAAKWSAKRLDGLKLSPTQYALKLREGVSIYYNLSSKGRAAWNGLNTKKLPIETRRHIANARIGAREAAELEAQLAELRGRMKGTGMMTASYGAGN
ncbi:lysozyme family protein [Ramlibacter alkalitolerans]|uniref:Lytic transglycosylase domain-containing protein n=1 Tax=Ramlibacter alkalitolerans TaxID=2039631 RepID=A0ABS1JJ59_9BURK|nr:hypothetical protein [Ramlibacter alkalitolerans]MBL0424254.1 hypothetical protein [Ramlibacter alkalitolerans]